MAVIGKIRKHYGLLVIVIGVALVAFILGDLGKNNNQRTTNVGTIDGEQISYQDFNTRYEQYVENTKQQSNTQPSNDDLYSIRNQTWNQLVKENIMNKEFDELGLVVSPDELFDQIQGNKPHSAVVQNFTNPETGKFDRDMVLKYLQNLNNLPQAQKDMWLNFERYIKEDRLNTKYTNLINKGFYLPKPLAAKAFTEKNTKSTVEVVALRYNTIPDSTVVITDKDFESFYNEKKGSYERPETRDIEFITFDVKPSQKDIQVGSEYINSLKEEFTTTENVVSFVNANSDTRYDSTWQGEKDVPAEIEVAMFGNEPGYVYGPYFENNTYHLVRLMDKAERSDSLKASHILLSYAGAMRSEQTRTKERAKAIADSLLKVINKQPKTLETLAVQFSDDPGSKEKQGDLDWFVDGMMVPSFNEFVQNNKVGTIGLVESDFGYHIIKVTERTKALPKVRVATITHNVTPSTQTYQDIFAQASKFATENKTKADFDKTIADQGLNKRVAQRIKKDDFLITGIENPRQIVRWAYDENTKVEDISDIFDLDNMYVIAVLTKKAEEGIVPLEELKESIKYSVINRKKGEMLAEKMTPYGKDVNKMITEIGAERDTVSDINFDGRSIKGFGQETEIIGQIYSMEKGQVYGPIKGNSAVYMITVLDQKPAEGTNYDASVREKTSVFTNAVRNNAHYNAIEKVTDIEDNRLLFY